MIYLDHAAATPVDPAVLEAMMPYFGEQFYNPSATYRAAQDVHGRLEQARADVAGVLGCRVREVIFTAGGTEANNLAVHGVMQQFPGSNLIVSSIEHDSVLRPAEQYDVRHAPVDEQGIALIDDLLSLVDDNTVLVSVMLANNEIGSVQPIRRLSQRLAEVRTHRRQTGNELPIYLHTDACQAANYLDLHVSRLGVDMMTLNGGKIYGPKQSGMLYVATGVQLRPQVLGGGQERGLRSGTENIAFAVGFACALAAAQANRHEQIEVHSQLQTVVMKQIDAELPDAKINGSLKHRLPNNIHVTLPGADNERLLFYLDEHGVQAAAGSACSASSDEPSHVLRAISVSDADARASMRFTFGRATTADDMESAVRILAEAYRSTVY